MYQWWKPSVNAPIRWYCRSLQGRRSILDRGAHFCDHMRKQKHGQMFLLSQSRTLGDGGDIHSLDLRQLEGNVLFLLLGAAWEGNELVFLIFILSLAARHVGKGVLRISIGWNWMAKGDF